MEISKAWGIVFPIFKVTNELGVQPIQHILCRKFSSGESSNYFTVKVSKFKEKFVRNMFIKPELICTLMREREI